jgi:hypothetical protein
LKKLLRIRGFWLTFRRRNPLCMPAAQPDTSPGLRNTNDSSAACDDIRHFELFVSIIPVVTEEQRLILKRF